MELPGHITPAFSFYICLSMYQIRPQQGFQEMALSTPADIAILGGAAGCGKTFTLLLEFLRHIRNPKYTSVIFRRTTPQITSPGGLWDTSLKLYSQVGGIPTTKPYVWSFPVHGSPYKAKINFSHLQYEKDLNDWQGSQIPVIGFDELTHFTETMFFYFLSRNRSDSGIKGYIRATCNPDPDSWVKKFISWWIDPVTGYPIEERAGKVRYMVRKDGVTVWGDTKQEVYEQCPDFFENKHVVEAGAKITDLIKSVTFIPGNIKDNKILVTQDPGYLGNLLSLDENTRAQLLGGNWKIRVDGLGIFHYQGIDNIYDNYPEKSSNATKCITLDAARFGRDLCVIYVWKGWEVIHMSIFKKSDVHDIVKHIEYLRRKFNVMRTNVVVDQDGVGDDTVKLGQYTGFHGNASAIEDPVTLIKENYKNLKTQCYYRIANRVNNGGIRFSISNGTCLIFDDGKLYKEVRESASGGYYSTKIMMSGEVRDVRDLIQEDLRAIKRDKVDKEGKLQINSKADQKLILGRSPDFGDTLMMREYIELLPLIEGMKRVA